MIASRNLRQQFYDWVPPPPSGLDAITFTLMLRNSFSSGKDFVYHKTQTKIGVEYGFTHKNLCIYHVLKLQCRFTWRAH